MTQAPTLAEVRAWLQTPATAIDDAQLGHVLAAELALQAEWLHVPEDPDAFPDALYQSALRRCGRECAARGVPLGLVGTDAEFGSQVLRRWDGEIERLEAPYVTQVLA
jgi:hypothetical protein